MPVASRMRTTACVTSGPMPSPGMRVTRCVLGSVIFSFPVSRLFVKSSELFAAQQVRIDERDRQTQFLFPIPYSRLLMPLKQPFEFFLEFAHIFEVAINGSEADVGDGVDAFEVAHDEFADLAGRALPLRRVDEKGFSGVKDGFQLLGRDGAFFAGAEQAAEHLLAIEPFAAPIL